MTRLHLAVALCLVGVAALVVRGEVMVRSGRVVTLPVAGADPRDLLSGHYLALRLDTDGGCDEEPCGACWDGTTLRGHPEGRREACPLYVAPESVSLRFYVPEDKAPHLEEMLRERHRRELEATLTPQGRLLPRVLLLDGEPVHVAAP